VLEQEILEVTSIFFWVFCCEATLAALCCLSHLTLPPRLQDVLDLSDDQRVALVAARRKLLSTAEEVNLQRQQVHACRVWKPVRASSQLFASLRSPPLSLWSHQKHSVKARQCSALLKLRLVWPADSATRAEGGGRTCAAIWSSDVGFTGDATAGGTPLTPLHAPCLPPCWAHQAG